MSNTITIQFGPNTMLAAIITMAPSLDIIDAIANINALERQREGAFQN